MNLIYLRRTVFKIIKKNKWIFYLYEYIKWHREIKYNKRINNQQDLKSTKQIKYEKKLIRNYWKIGTFHYYRYGLQYKNLSSEEILDFIPTYYFHKNIERKHKKIDTIKFGDKLIQAELFENRKIPTANTIAILKNNKLFDFLSKREIDFQTTIETYLHKGGSKLFFKPTGNCGGAGIIVLKKVNNQLFLNGQNISSYYDILSKINKSHKYIVQENIIQCKQFNKINPSSVNTIRVVAQNENNNMVIKSCILRMGRAGKEIDNSAQGGISIKIDCNTGKLENFATAEHGGGKYFSHPDSNFIFENNFINNWEEIKFKIELIANKLVDFNDIALDIAITTDKVILIEFNFRYGIEHQQCVLGGMRRVLNIYNK